MRYLLGVGGNSEKVVRTFLQKGTINTQWVKGGKRTMKKVKKLLITTAVALALFGGTATVVSARTEVARVNRTTPSGQNNSGTMTVSGSGRRVTAPWAHSQFQVWTTVNTPTAPSTGNQRVAGAQARSSNNISSRTGIVVTERGNGSLADREAKIMRIAFNNPSSRGTLFDR